jgi:RNA polymerase sigma factor (sigma-70 family)
MREDKTRELGSYESVLWRVLGALARNGYAVPPSDARDLIHDFYLDAWEGINQRFDPKLGSFAGYVTSAFYRFARRRILKTENFKRRTVDFDSAVAYLSSDSTPPDILESRERHQAASTALAQLTPLERTILEEHLAGDGVSERELAQRHNLSRYGVREVLADSLGKVAVSLGQTRAVSNTAENIAELLWKYGQSPRDVASLLNMPVADVQVARNHVVSTLLNELRHPNGRRFTGRLKMKHQEALELLGSALTSLGNEKALSEVRENRGEIQQALDKSDLVLNEKLWSELQAHPEWIARVYESLAGAKAETEPTEVSTAIATIREQEEREIGEAFTTLLEELPANFHSWGGKWFREVQPAPADYRNEILHRTSVQSAGAAAHELVFFGMTPETIYSATRGLQLLFNRTEQSARSGVLPMVAPGTRPGFTLPKAVKVDYGLPSGPVSMPDTLILAEVAATPNLPAGAEKGLTCWLIEALQYKPYLIEGYSAHVDKYALALQRTPVTRRGAIQRGDLISQWTRAHPLYLDRAAAASAS